MQIGRAPLGLLATALLLGSLPRIDAVSRLYPPDRDQRTDVRRYYASMAEAALSGRGWLPAYPTNFVPPPGQALFIYAFRRALPGLDDQHLRAVQALVSIVTIAAAFAVGWLWRDAWVGSVAAALLALEYRLSEMVGTLLPETNHIFLLFACLVALAAAFRCSRSDVFAAAGLLLGIACLFKPIPSLLGPMLAVFLALRLPAGIKPALALLLAFAGAIAPWIVRNWIHYGQLHPISTNGGTLLALANAPELDASRPDMRYWDDLYRLDYYRAADVEARFAFVIDRDGKREENEKDRAYRQRALNYVLRSPLHFSRNYLYKLRNFVLYPAGGLTDWSNRPWPFRGSTAGLYATTALGLLGTLALLLNRGDSAGNAIALTILYFLLVGALYHLTADGRMNLPFRALLTLPAAYAVVAAARRLRYR